MAGSKRRRARIIRIVETFLGEAAVLLAVFPILDEFVQRGREGVTLKLVMFSMSGAGFLLLSAITLAVVFDEEDS